MMQGSIEAIYGTDSKTYYGNILREGTAACSTFAFYSRASSVSCRLHAMAVNTHSVTLFVNMEKAGHRKRRDYHGRVWVLPGGDATLPLSWKAATLSNWLKRAVGRINRALLEGFV
eukprot:jgi/Tetstr1/432975/TSEL_022312.t1